ncbi:MAG TPA: CPBP family intramembrane metalloprotease [Kiritimatiellia bacterium]|nr:CPBP family intramembrane metalloprotease [Kiritimatiellia bacterium]
MAFFRTLPLAELGGFDALAFEQQLQEQAAFIGIVYGGAFLIGLCLLIVFTMRIQNRPLSWAVPLDTLSRRPWDMSASGFIILPLIGVQLVFMLVLRWWGGAMDQGDGRVEVALLVLQSLLFHWICFALIFGIMKQKRVGWSQAFGIQLSGIPREIFAGIVIILGVMPLIIGYNFVARMVMDWIQYAPEIQDVTRIISAASGWGVKAYLVLLAVVVAPVVEELLFRGVLLPAISRLAGVKFAIVAVSILFAAVHGTYLPQSIIFFILSVAFCLAYIYRQSIVTSIAMHALFNSLTIAVILRL